MGIDRSFEERNRAATTRMRELAARLSDDELQRPVGEHWTVSIAFAHLAFWDGRVLAALDATEHDRQVNSPDISTIVNDIALPLWRAIPSREAVAIAIATAERLDQRLATFNPDLLEQIAVFNERYVERSRHRNGHLDEVDQALQH